MDVREAWFFLGALNTEFPRMEYPVCSRVTAAQREEIRGKTKEALETALTILGNLEAEDIPVLHERRL